jgi:hypothetical protein
MHVAWCRCLLITNSRHVVVAAEWGWG